MISRDFTVAVFVVHRQKVLLLFHRKLQRWLPPGGHIEVGEIPDAAAVREVQEETGITVDLVGARALEDVAGPRQLVIPQGIQLEDIEPGHQHIDLVYFARPVGLTDIHPNDEAEKIGWYGKNDLSSLALTDEMAAWIDKALRYFADGLSTS